MSNLKLLKNQINSVLSKYYQKNIYRKFKMNKYK